MTQAMATMVQQHAPEVILTSEPALSPYLEAYPECVRVLDYLMVQTLSLERLGALAWGFKRWIWSLRWERSAAYHRHVAPMYDLCLVNSEEDHADLLTHCPSWPMLEFFPNGLMLDEYPLSLAEPDRQVLVYPGSVTYFPNRDAVAYMIASILPLVRAEIPNVRFVVTGAVPEDGSAPQGEGVTYTGRVADVRPVIAGAWVCVVPLRSGAGGTRFKVLEAMALGTPLVSTTIGAEGVDWTDGTDILISDTAEDFARNIVRLLKSPNVRAQQSQAGRQLIEERYDWNVLGSRISELLHKLVEKKRSDGQK
jgi:polysaccharide biosynthesis protein PslH